MADTAHGWLTGTAWATDEGVEAMRDALLAVLDLHQPNDNMYGDGSRECQNCADMLDWAWPCATVRAVNEALGVG